MIKVCLRRDTVNCVNDATDARLCAFAAEAIDKTYCADYLKGARFLVGSGAAGKLAESLAAECVSREIKVRLYFADSSVESAEFARRTGIKAEDLADFQPDGGVVFDCLSPDKYVKKVQKSFVSAAKKVNSANGTVISVTVPFGLNPDSGEPADVAVEADVTLCYAAATPGLFLGKGLNYSGKTVAIGDADVKILGFVTDENKAALPPRKRATHKGDYGKIAVIGGSDTMPGAPLMAYQSAVAASLSGAGLVRLCVGEDEKCAYKSRVLEQTLFFLPEKDGYIRFDKQKLSEIMAFADVIAIGPGMGNNPFLPEIIGFLCRNYAKTLVLDADALNAVAKNPSVTSGHVCRLILTPHVGEFARLAPEIKPFDVKKIKAFARRTDCVLALKSACTIITDGRSVFFNPSGTPALAKGGSGDVLCGVIAALAAVSDPLDAAVKGCYRFGAAAEKAVSISDEAALLARDVIQSIKNN